MGKIPLWLLMMLLWMGGAAGAAEPVLTVDPGDSPLVIYGKLDGQTTAFGGDVRLTATGDDVKELLMLPSGMKGVGDDNVIIDRSNVTVPSGISLNKGQPRDIRVTVNNVTRPGEYAGSLKFLLPGQSEDKALKIGLTLRIDSKPKVQPVFPNMTFQLVRCQNPIACAVSTWLLPASAIREDWAVYLDNQTLAPIEMTDATVVMRGEKTGHAINPDVISLTLSHPLPLGKVEPIMMTIHRNRLLPDRYQGTLRFKVKGSDDPVIINIDLNLRDSPIWAVLIILAGIIVGRLARGMSTPEAQKQIKFLPRLYQLRDSADRLENAEARTYLAGQIQDASEQIALAKETEEVLSQVLDKLKGRIDFLGTLEGLEHQLTKFDALIEELKPTIQAARQELIYNRVEEAERLRKKVEARLQEVQQDKTMGVASDLFDTFFKSFRASTARWSEAEKAKAPTRPGGMRWGWLAKVMTTLSGTEVMSAELRYWFVRPLLFLILLAVLALLGLQTLYVSAGSAFGAAGLYDYLGLFLWGLSADIAQRTLQNLPAPKS